MNIILAKPTFSPDDLLAMPDGDAYELVDGQLVQKNVSALSGLVETRLVIRVGAHCEQHQLGPVWSGTTGFRCFPDKPKKVRRPDLAFVKAERVSIALLKGGFVTLAPDLAAEVISPGDLACELQEKIEEYLQAGAWLVWVIAPEIRVVDVYRKNGTGVRLRESDELSGEDVIPGFRCRVGDLFPPRSQS